jgi:type I restriction enzyme S subunit
MVRSAAMVSLLDGNPRFVMYMLQSDYLQEQIKKLSKQTAQANLFLGAISALIIPFPDIKEQNEIVRILDFWFERERISQKKVEMLIDQIDTIKKAILARAFRGELGTNDPSEESAKTLINQVLEERIKAQELESKRTPRKKKEVLIVVKTILETLKSAEKLTPEKLKAETRLEIDDFYDQLKVMIDSGQVREIRIDGESYLEAAL